ncbi:MAG: MurR/RpiR family transcriptional regulator [Casimicrobiaceae bacterium]|jgi:DNA-binding MurR/RpiR family transcriptional regulator
MTPPTTLATIARCYPDLPPRLQRAARFIIENPDQIAVRSMREIARRAGVAPATMVRLARAIDFADYGDLRDVFIRRVEAPAAAHATRAVALQASKHSGPMLVEHLAAAQIAAVHSSAANPEAAVAAFLRDLAAARTVAFLGMRASHAIAYHFAYVYGLLRDNGHLLDDHGGALRDHAARLCAGDALIAISLAPYTRATVEAVDVAERRGATILALTDSAVSPLARAARHVLLFRTAGPSFFSTMAGALALAEMLVARLAASGGRAVIKRLERTDNALREAGAYWDASWTRFPAADRIPRTAQ